MDTQPGNRRDRAPPGLDAWVCHLGTHPGSTQKGPVLGLKPGCHQLEILNTF